MAAEPDPKKYPTFNDFFTRKLDFSKRNVILDPHTIISPVDGKISQQGSINHDQIIQAKGISYSLTQLLGNQQAETYYGGEFITFYLSPRDYHRVHMPLSGELLTMRYIPGKLFSVNEATAQAVPKLFTKNERGIAEFQTEIGRVSLIMVGAMLVAGIHTAWAGQITPNQKSDVQVWYYQQKEVSLKQGEEMGHFELGSTVIILFPAHTIKWAKELVRGSSIAMGNKIASVRTAVN